MEPSSGLGQFIEVGEFVTHLELAAIAYDADRRLRMAAGETGIADWDALPQSFKDSWEALVAATLRHPNHHLPPIIARGMGTVRSGFASAIIAALHEYVSEL